MLLARDFDLCCVIRNLIYVAQSRARSMLRSRGRYMSVERGIGSLTLFGDRQFNIHSVIGRLISSMRRYVSLHNDYNGFWVQGPSRVPRTYRVSCCRYL